MSIEDHLSAARKNLLDLTMRNHLLNYRPAKARSIKVIGEIPREIFDILALQEKTMKFSPKPASTLTTQATLLAGLQPSEPLTDDPPEDFSELPDDAPTGEIWELPVEPHHTDDYLQTNLEPEALQKRLFYISQEARSALEEMGQGILYLALGFLEWTESDSSTETRKAPLVLVPVELERAAVRAPFRLKWSGEDIGTNVSLKEKLREQGVAFPDFAMPDAKEGVDEYLEKVRSAVSAKRRWRVNGDIHLDFFSFAKFLLYKDLDPDAWPSGMSPAQHELIKALLEPSSQNNGPGFSEDEVDIKLNVRDVYHIMDSDPSQIAAIEDVKAGRNLVVEGPPGTGKSQTITNLIAELLAKGKSVLFVSEKMAALSVVKDRLDRGNLGDYCLELHSRKSNKREVLKELERTIMKSPPRDASLDAEFKEIEFTKETLNDYARSLREPVGRVSLSPFELMGTLERIRRHFDTTGKEMPRFTMSAVDKLDKNDWIAAISAVDQLSDCLSLVSPIESNPWKDCHPGLVLPGDEQEIGTELEQCIATLDSLTAKINEMKEATGTRDAKTESDVGTVIAAAQVIASSTPTDKVLLLNEAWNKPNAMAETLIEAVKSYREKLSSISEELKPASIDRDISTDLTEYKVRSARHFLVRLFDKKHRQLHREFSSLYLTEARRSVDCIIRDMSAAADVQRIRSYLRSQTRLGGELFGSHWRNEESNPDTLNAFAIWILSFRRQLLDEALTERAINIVESQNSREATIKLVEAVTEALGVFVTARNDLVKKLGFDFKETDRLEAPEVTFGEFRTRLIAWRDGLHRLQNWARFTTLVDSAAKTAALPVIPLIRSGTLAPADVALCFEGNLAEGLLRFAFSTRPSLAHFISNLHEKKIKDFMRVDESIILGNRKRLARKVYDNQPRGSAGASGQSEWGILQGEINRKRGHMPIRRLMEKAGGLIQRIKPCFMMSPLSIAQFLDPKTVKFDVIIFDEASQVRPEDALGALLRGKQVVVMGDTRQLPPTSFFDRLTQDTDNQGDSDVAQITDVESILHQCKRAFPTKFLTWHYRSRHESLIAVSNQEFYDNKLRVYPSPLGKSAEIGLQFEHLPDTVYDRGKSSINRKEAQRVAEAAINHFRRYPDKSLGIGTFNIKQQQAILEEIEIQLREHPEMEPHFQSSREDHFFVKNLETIQGDERDVIFISVGFGKDERGVLTLNFGPLNQEGGERRLNVLISRARERCVTFANFRANDLSIGPNASFGLRALKTFLGFAETGNLYSTEIPREDADSPFEESVYEFLRENGHEVHKQIGCAGFRVDLGIVDSAQPGRYLLGIECDGAKYHSSPVARDRDRLRQQILEQLGWKIHRVWSTDWYRNPAATKQRLIEVTNQVKNGDYSSVWHAPEQPTREAAPVQHDVGEEDYGISESGPEDEVVDYEKCESLGDISRHSGNLHEISPSAMADFVSRVVQVEGPVHIEEVARRIRMLWGLNRTGSRIADAVSKGADLAVRKGLVRRQESFLCAPNASVVQVRRRGTDTAPKAELISDEEIAQAFRLVLKYQFDTAPNDLILRASRLFGFQSLHSNTSSRLKAVLTSLCDRGELEHRVNGMIHLVEQTK